MRQSARPSVADDTDDETDLGTGWYWLLRLASVGYLLSLCCVIPAGSGGRFEKHATLVLIGYGSFLMTELGIRALVRFWVGQYDPWWPVSLTSGSRLKGLPVWVFGLFFFIVGIVNGVREFSAHVAARSSASASSSEETP